MEKFKELSLEEMKEVEGGNMGSDAIAWVGYYSHKVWCDIKKAYYDSKKINNMRGEESVFSLWGF
jgi:bacteriocin-like protein